MNNNSTAGLFTSANSSTSTLRPRNTRLISYLDEDPNNPTSHETAETAAITTSSISSRTASALSSRRGTPSPGPTRRRSINKKVRPLDGGDQERSRSETGQYAPVNGIWESWSSLQGIASSFLGSDISGNKSPKLGKPTSTFKTPAWMKQDRTAGSLPSSPKWGPQVNHTASTALPGSIEERQALVQAKRREALLLADPKENRDSAGRFKRRDSNTDLTINNDQITEEEALVYLHNITPEDTLAGVMIKYGCQPEVFRKVNRFWPNDNIQTRTHVYLPVDACSIRGTKVDNQVDLLNSGLDSLGVSNKTTTPTSDDTTLEPTISLSLVNTPLETEEGYKHDSWMQLISHSTPTEVLRIPRRKLGYFPPTRRKSNNALRETSVSSTPKTSFDMLRHPPTHAASMSLNSSPVRRNANPKVSQSHLPHRSRSSSTSQTSFVDALRGPGGVGTLRGLRTEISRPGPADDPLNRKFAAYLPDLAPPKEMPSPGLMRILSSSSQLSPRASIDSIRSSRSNTSVGGGLTANVGGAIEGWVRTFTGSGASKRDRNFNSAPKMGDLIELETNSSSIDDLLNSQDSPTRNEHGARRDSDVRGKRGEDDRTPTPTAQNFGIGSMRSDLDKTPKATQDGFQRDGTGLTRSEQELLDERFPVRGRVRTAYTQK